MPQSEDLSSKISYISGRLTGPSLKHHSATLCCICEDIQAEEISRIRDFRHRLIDILHWHRAHLLAASSISPQGMWFRPHQFRNWQISPFEFLISSIINQAVTSEEGNRESFLPAVASFCWCWTWAEVAWSLFMLLDLIFGSSSRHWFCFIGVLIILEDPSHALGATLQGWTAHSRHSVTCPANESCRSQSPDHRSWHTSKR